MKIQPDPKSSSSGLAELIAVARSDLQVLADYSRGLWQAAYEPGILSGTGSQALWARSYSLSALLSAFDSGEQFFWVVIGGGRAGFVAYRWNPESQVLWLSKLYLHPDYWGRGLGAWVLQSVTNAALRARALRIDLYVFRRNVRAVEAYRRAGFRVDREELTDLGGGVVYDDFVMVKVL